MEKDYFCRKGYFRCSECRGVCFVVEASVFVWLELGMGGS